MKRSLRSWLWRVPLDQEVDEEIAFHVEMRTHELVEGGMDPNDRARDGPAPAWRCHLRPAKHGGTGKKERSGNAEWPSGSKNFATT